MDREQLLDAFVNSMPDPVVITGLDHRIIYMNREAINLFEGGADLIGSSLFDCHKEEKSNQVIREVFERLQNGEEEVQITDRSGRREGYFQHTYMRAIRDSEGKLVAYYERYKYWPGRID